MGLSLNKLHTLSIERNFLEELPNSLGNCTNLTYLNLNQSKIKNIPDSFTKLQNLNYLSLSENHVKIYYRQYNQIFIA